MGDPGQHVDHAHVEPFPAGFRLLAERKPAVIEREVQGSLVGEFGEQLWQRRPQAGPAARVHLRAAPQQGFVLVDAGGQALSGQFERPQRQGAFARFAAHDRGRAGVDRRQQGRPRIGLTFGHLTQQGRRQAEICRRAGGQLGDERGAQRRLGHQRQIDEINVNRIIMLADFVQRVEAGQQVLTGCCLVASQCRASRGQRLVLEMRLVEIDRVAHLAGE